MMETAEVAQEDVVQQQIHPSVNALSCAQDASSQSLCWLGGHHIPARGPLPASPNPPLLPVSGTNMLTPSAAFDAYVMALVRCRFQFPYTAAGLSRGCLRVRLTTAQRGTGHAVASQGVPCNGQDTTMKRYMACTCYATTLPSRQHILPHCSVARHSTCLQVNVMCERAG